jgi:hypothetical protein
VPEAALAAATGPAFELAPAATPVSTTSLSPLELGDAISSLTLAVAGVGAPGSGLLAGMPVPDGVAENDAWALAVESPTGWYVMLTQDCDIVREDEAEPTVLVAPLVLITRDKWDDLQHNGYSSRHYAYPLAKFTALATDQGLAVDLAWTTSVLKGALRAPNVRGLRAMTGPNKRDFGDWVAARSGRVPFPDDVVTKVLDPCYDTRQALLSTFRKRSQAGSAPVETRVVAAAERWFASYSGGRQVHILGQVTGRSLNAAQLTTNEGAVLEDELEKGVEKLTARVLNRMNKVDEHSGFQLIIQLMDLSQMRASEFLQFSLLLR